jgi:hypothetical protein
VQSSRLDDQRCVLPPYFTQVGNFPFIHTPQGCDDARGLQPPRLVARAPSLLRHSFCALVVSGVCDVDTRLTNLCYGNLEPIAAYCRVWAPFATLQHSASRPVAARFLTLLIPLHAFSSSTVITSIGSHMTAAAGRDIHWHSYDRCSWSSHPLALTRPL